MNQEINHTTNIKSILVSGTNGFSTEGLYRLPWTMADNSMTWLEPTQFCNIKCDACFHFSDPKSHKSLQEIKQELESLMKLRKCDAMLIAGGEPLTHPDIIEITRLVKSFKVKPILMTNGVGLTEEKTRELKKAGLSGITFHIDSHQNRPGWTGKTETELNTLREEMAEMLNRVRGLTCAYNTTIFPDTLEEVPSIVEWAMKNIDKVNILSLIAVRMVNNSMPYDYYVGNKKIAITETPYNSEVSYTNLMAGDIYRQLEKVMPGYRFNSFLGGTSKSDSPKWLLSTHAGIPGKSFGNLGPRAMEFLQTMHHLFWGNYLGFNVRNVNKKGKGALLLGIFDSLSRKTCRSYIKELIKKPALFFKPLYIQSITIVQPVDVLPTGENDNCDGCPNKTLWNDRLVSACRLEEYLLYGGPINTVPR